MGDELDLDEDAYHPYDDDEDYEDDYDGPYDEDDEDNGHCSCYLCEQEKT
jgi:hypothetical protein